MTNRSSCLEQTITREPRPYPSASASGTYRATSSQPASASRHTGPRHHFRPPRQDIRSHVITTGLRIMTRGQPVSRWNLKLSTNCQGPPSVCGLLNMFQSHHFMAQYSSLYRTSGMSQARGIVQHHWPRVRGTAPGAVQVWGRHQDCSTGVGLTSGLQYGCGADTRIAV